MFSRYWLRSKPVSQQDGSGDGYQYPCADLDDFMQEVLFPASEQAGDNQGNQDGNKENPEQTADHGWFSMDGKRPSEGCGDKRAVMRPSHTNHF